MRRGPSGSSEEQDTDPNALPATPLTHGDKGSEKRRDIGKHTQDNSHKKEKRKGDAHKQGLPALTRVQSTTSEFSALPPRNEDEGFTMYASAKDIIPDSMAECHSERRLRLRDHWAYSLYTIVTTILGFGLLVLMVQSFMARQLDTKGCEMCYMRPAYAKMSDFDTEHTRFAGKYSLYFYREGLIDEDVRVGTKHSKWLLSG